MNAEPTPFDAIAHALFAGIIGEVLPRLVGAEVGTGLELAVGAARGAT